MQFTVLDILEIRIRSNMNEAYNICMYSIGILSRVRFRRKAFNHSITAVSFERSHQSDCIQLLRVCILYSHFEENTSIHLH